MRISSSQLGISSGCARCGSDSRRMILSLTSSVGGDPVLCRFYIIKESIDLAKLVDPAADDTRSCVEDVPGMLRGRP